MPSNLAISVQLCSLFGSCFSAQALAAYASDPTSRTTLVGAWESLTKLVSVAAQDGNRESAQVDCHFRRHSCQGRFPSFPAAFGGG